MERRGGFEPTPWLPDGKQAEEIKPQSKEPNWKEIAPPDNDGVTEREAPITQPKEQQSAVESTQSLPETLRTDRVDILEQSDPELLQKKVDNLFEANGP